MIWTHKLRIVAGGADAGQLDKLLRGQVRLESHIMDVQHAVYNVQELVSAAAHLQRGCNMNASGELLHKAYCHIRMFRTRALVHGILAGQASSDCDAIQSQRLFRDRSTSEFADTSDVV
eukprot:1644387-Amphidinium_carterae.1